MAFAFAQVWSERMEVFYPWRDGRGRPKGFLQSITCVCIYVSVNVCVFQEVSGVIGELALTQAKRWCQPLALSSTVWMNFDIVQSLKLEAKALEPPWHKWCVGQSFTWVYSCLWAWWNLSPTERGLKEPVSPLTDPPLWIFIDSCNFNKP